MTLSQPTWSPLCLTTQMVRYDHPTPRICALVIQIFWISKLHNSQPNDVNTNLMQAWHRRHSTCGASELCFYTKLLVVINMMNLSHCQQAGGGEQIRSWTWQLANPHPCNMCVKSFKYSSQLASHMLTHIGEKLHICSECNKSFSQAVNLKTHMLIHSGEKSHKCAECNKSFRLAGHLKTHLLTHSGVKMHLCPDCSKSFSKVVNLKRHLLIHSGEKNQKCEQCDKTFSQPVHLKTHLLTHSGEKMHFIATIHQSR